MPITALALLENSDDTSQDGLFHSILKRIFSNIIAGRLDFTSVAGLHVTGCKSGSLGTLCVAVDWRVRVFMSYGIVDRPSDHMFIQTRASVWVHGQTIELQSLKTINYTKNIIEPSKGYNGTK